MAGTITTKIGDGSVNRFVLLALIAGTGITSYGDAADAASANASLASGTAIFQWGWTSAVHRATPVWNFDLTGLLPRKITIARAYVRIFPTGKSVPIGYVYPGWTFALHEVEPTLDSGIDWQESAAGVPWAGGYGPKAGLDFDSVAVGSTTIDASLFAGLASGTGTVDPAVYFDVDITAAVQRAIDQKRPLRILAPVPFASPGAACLLSIRNPNSSSTGVRPHLVVEYQPAIGVVSPNLAESGRPPDFSKLHDPLAAGTSNRTYLDAIEQGTTGPAVKEWAVNFRRSGPRRGVILGTSRAECDPVDNSGSVSGITLRHIVAYDNDTAPTPDTYSPEGKLTVEALSGTTYRLGLTPPGGSITYLLDSVSGIAAVDHASDHHFLYNSKTAFSILTDDWSATTGANASDRYYTNCRPDQRTTQSTETLGLVQVMPPTPLRFGDAGDTAKARVLLGAYTQQMWAPATDVNISGTTHTHVEVRNTDETDWIVGEPVTLISEDGETVVESAIEAVYGRAHGTYPFQIRLATQLSAPQLALMTATATITGGIWIGDLATNQARTLAEGAGIGENTITLTTAFDGVPGAVQIVDSTLGTTEVVDVISGTLELQLAANLTVAFTAGSTVFAIIDSSTSPDSMFAAPYFVNGEIPSDQEEGLYSGFYVFHERRTV